MFDFRLRRLNDDGTKGAVLATGRPEVTLTDSVASLVRFTVSRKVAGALPNPFLVSVEYTTGTSWRAVRGNVMIVSKAAREDTDPAGTVAYAGSNFLVWLMARMYVQGTATSGLQRTWPDATPGALAAAIIAEAKVWGWNPNVTVDFTGTTDSNGVPWKTEDRTSIQWQVGTPMNQVLEKLAEQGKAEWWTEGLTLRLVRPGTGVDRSDEVVLGGPAFSSVPVDSTFDDVFTMLTVFYGDASVDIPNPGASDRFGALWATMSQNGVTSSVEAIQNAQPTLTMGRALREEIGYDWTPAAGGPVPFEDFQVGDVVKAMLESGDRPLRVIGLVLTKPGGVVSVRAKVGDKLLGLIAKLSKQAGSSKVGSIVGGNGTPLPSAPGPTGAKPLAPTSLRVASNVGSWREDGTAQASVELAWNAVTQAADNSAVDVAAYEVAVRTPESEPQIFATVTGLTASASEWEPGKERLVRVRARDHRGQVSAWSDEISVIPQVPASIVPKAPTNLREVSNVATFQKDGRAVATVTFEWDAVALSIEDVLVDIAEYEVIHGLSTQRVPGLLGSITIPSDADAEVRVRVRTTLGVWSDPSEPLILKGALPAVNLAAPTLTMVGGMGGVVAAWDGLLGGAAVPAGFARVVLELGTSATGPWTAQGIPWDAAGSQSVAAPIGQKRWARARAFDTLGRAGAYSAVVEATALGIAVSDIPGLEGDIDEIRYTADGKNRIYVSVTEPVRDRGRNYFNDPSFSAPGGYDPWLKATHTNPFYNRGIRKAGTGAQNGAYFPSTEFAVSPGQKFRLEMTLVAWSGPTSTGQLTVYARPFIDGAWGPQFGNVRGTTPGAATEYVYSNEMTVPAGTSKVQLGFFTESNMPATQGVLLAALHVELARSGDLWFQLDPTGASVVSVKVWNGTAWAPQVLYAEHVIATGSIVGTLIKAGTIQADNLHPSVGDSINLFANGAINMLVGRANDADSHLGTLDGQVQDAQASADDAHAAAVDAAGAAANVGTRLDQHQTYYRFGPTGLAIGDPAAAAELRLSPTAIEMRQNSVVVSRWEGGVFVADEVRLKSASVANHKWEAYGPGRSILRPLSQ